MHLKHSLQGLARGTHSARTSSLPLEDQENSQTSGLLLPLPHERYTAQTQPEHPQRPAVPRTASRSPPSLRSLVTEGEQARPYLALRELLQADGTHGRGATAATGVRPLSPRPPAAGPVPPGGQLADGPGCSLLKGILGRGVGLRLGQGLLFPHPGTSVCTWFPVTQ